jgi:hypothetical protein
MMYTQSCILSVGFVNAPAVAEEYQRRFQRRGMSYSFILFTVHRKLRKRGKLPTVLSAEHAVRRNLVDENITGMVHRAALLSAL